MFEFLIVAVIEEMIGDSFNPLITESMTLRSFLISLRMYNLEVISLREFDLKVISLWEFDLKVISLWEYDNKLKLQMSRKNILNAQSPFLIPSA